MKRITRRRKGYINHETYAHFIQTNKEVRFGMDNPEEWGQGIMKQVSDVAIIFPPPGGDWNPALISVAGISVFTRILLAAERSGIKQFFILSGDNTIRLRELLAERVIKAGVHWYDTDSSQFIQYLQKIHTPFFSLNAAILVNQEIFRYAVKAYGDDAEIHFPAIPDDNYTIGGVALADPQLLIPFSQIIAKGKLPDWL
ncbi:MAG: hypothetical protein SV375_15210, partial [Thermodesulfobacteriota bacterium]|nr:hypothetical protein [Thermodesulfobacteriota bacterium]